MKTKLEMAHEYLLRFSGATVADAWAYADAMQVEADKRKPSEFPSVLRGACGEIVAVKVDDKDWQPDWSQVPVWANWWSVDENGTANFSGKKPNIEGRQWVYYSAASENLCHIEAPSFGYTGDWRNSLRKRPQ